MSFVFVPESEYAASQVDHLTQPFHVVLGNVVLVHEVGIAGQKIHNEDGGVRYFVAIQRKSLSKQLDCGRLMQRCSSCS